jgi:hypothetical protein
MPPEISCHGPFINVLFVCPAGCSELLSSLLKLTEDEEDLALIIPGQLAHFFFSAGMRKAVTFFTVLVTCYLLLGALSPVLHVDGSRTRPGKEDSI